jgi:hypothetical protein
VLLVFYSIFWCRTSARSEAFFCVSFFLRSACVPHSKYLVHAPVQSRPWCRHAQQDACLVLFATTDRPGVKFLQFKLSVFYFGRCPVKPKLTARFRPLPICFFTRCTSCLRVAFRRIFFSRCPFLCSRVDLGFDCLGLILAATAGICFAVRVFPPVGAGSAASHAGSARLHSFVCVCRSFSLQLTHVWSSILSRRLRSWFCFHLLLLNRFLALPRS